MVLSIIPGVYCSVSNFCTVFSMRIGHRILHTPYLHLVEYKLCETILPLRNFWNYLVCNYVVNFTCQFFSSKKRDFHLSAIFGSTALKFFRLCKVLLQQLEDATSEKKSLPVRIPHHRLSNVKMSFFC